MESTLNGETVAGGLACRADNPSIRAGGSLRLSAPVAIALACAVLCVLPGCVSANYRFASKDMPPARALNVHFPPAPLAADLASVITDGTPGSWKQEAFWDEYVVVLHNTGEQPLEVASVTLVDFAGTSRASGDDPWALERESKTLERKYQDSGMAFARVAAPRILLASAEPVVIASAGIGVAGAAAAATATAVALPVYGLTIWGINRHHKSAIKAEFNRRRLPLPLSLAPGETRTGSLFFPMLPNPRSIDLNWSIESGTGDSVLPLDFLYGLHVPAATAASMTPKTPLP
jgi:hypothetical protein